MIQVSADWCNLARIPGTSMRVWSGLLKVWYALASEHAQHHKREYSSKEAHATSPDKHASRERKPESSSTCVYTHAHLCVFACLYLHMHTGYITLLCGSRKNSYVYIYFYLFIHLFIHTYSAYMDTYLYTYTYLFIYTCEPFVRGPYNQSRAY